MDWARAIDINQTALTRIVAALLAMVGLAGEKLSRPVYCAVTRVLRPAESAVRRLIIIAARGVVVRVPPARPMPAGRVVVGKGGARVSFQLFDPRKRFGHERRHSAGPRLEPRIHVFGPSPFAPVFRPATRYGSAPVQEPDDTVNAARLSRRLAAIKAALENLPRQAKRFARWQARRDLKQNPKFRSPLRPGKPPGYRRKPTHDVDHVLIECHGLARDVLRNDTS